MGRVQSPAIVFGNNADLLKKGGNMKEQFMSDHAPTLSFNWMVEEWHLGIGLAATVSAKNASHRMTGADLEYIAMH
jgi:hypothetical protein